MGNLGLPDPGVTDLSVSISLFLVTSSLLVHCSFSFRPLPSLSLDLVFCISFIPLILLSCPLRAPFVTHCYVVLLFSFSFCQSSFISVLLSIVDLNDIFGRKFRSNREKHFTLSGFLLRALLSLFARTRAVLPFFIGLFVNNCDARRT